MVISKHAKHTRGGALITDLIVTIFRADGRLLRTGDRMVRDLGLTSARWQVMMAIEKQPRTVAQIAREFELSRQGVLWVVQSMVKDGVVELIHNPDHQRAKLVQLTAKGQAGARQINLRQKVWANMLAEAFDPESLQVAIAIIQQFADMIVATGDDEPSVNGRLRKAK